MRNTFIPINHSRCSSEIHQWFRDECSLKYRFFPFRSLAITLQVAAMYRTRMARIITKIRRTDVTTEEVYSLLQAHLPVGVQPVAQSISLAKANLPPEKENFMDSQLQEVSWLHGPSSKFSYDYSEDLSVIRPVHLFILLCFLVDYVLLRKCSQNKETKLELSIDDCNEIEFGSRCIEITIHYVKCYM